MSEHHASVTIEAPVHQVYTLFTHFNDFPKFMSFIKEVTYYDKQRSHWVAQVAGQHEWDAVNEDWIVDQQIGWRSTSGLNNTGKVKFQPLGPDRTMLDVYINYEPPAGILGKTADALGVESRFDEALQKDLNHFAHMVEQAPPGALDPMQSHYLFQGESAVARNETTERQQQSMANDPMMSQQSMQQRQKTIKQEIAREQQAQQYQATQQEQLAQRAQQHAQEQASALQHQAELDRQARQQREAAARTEMGNEQQLPDSIQGTLGGRNASMERTALGERDARNRRFPHEEEDPMLARTPRSKHDTGSTPVEQIETESPWQKSIRGNTEQGATENQQSPFDTQKDTNER
jgi:ribosome-associated toxin RatA of RatAB toxin-antitoxin module